MPTELSAFLMTQMFITLHLLHMQFLHTKNLHLPVVVWVPTLKNLQRKYIHSQCKAGLGSHAGIPGRLWHLEQQTHQKKINSIKCKALEFDLILPVESGPKQGFHPPRLPPTANEDREDNGNRNQI